MTASSINPPRLMKTVGVGGVNQTDQEGQHSPDPAFPKEENDESVA